MHRRRCDGRMTSPYLHEQPDEPDDFADLPLVADEQTDEPAADAAAGTPGSGTGQMDLEDRNSLRRVASLSTELEDISEVEYRQLRLERVVLVGVWAGGSAEDAENSLAELKLLAETAGSQVLEALLQRRQRPDPATYVGRGKVEDLREAVQASGADTVVCDGELTPSQLRNLEDRVKVKVVDRTALILDIFAQHAKSAEGKAQVELAQLRYLTQRLRGWGGNLSRQAGGRVGSQGGGIGGRGPGETKLETDRRRINTKIAKLRRELKKMRTTRDTKKAERRRHDVPAVSIAGYTNAGKSSPAQPAHRRRRAGRGRAVRDARPHHPPHPDHRRPALHAQRHRRLRPAPAAPAGRGVPLHAGGGRRRRPRAARRRRGARRPRGPAHRRPRGAGRDRRRGDPRDRRRQQVRRRRPDGARQAAGARAARGGLLGPHRCRHRRRRRRDRGASSRTRRSRWPCCCPTSAATC